MKTLFLLFVMVGIMVSTGWGQTRISLFARTGGNVDTKDKVLIGTTIWQFDGWEVNCLTAYSRVYYDDVTLYECVIDDYYTESNIEITLPSEKMVTFKLQVEGSGGFQYSNAYYTMIP